MRPSSALPRALLALVALSSFAAVLVSAAPMPSPVVRVDDVAAHVARRSRPTPAPAPRLRTDASPDAVLRHFAPVQRLVAELAERGDAALRNVEEDTKAKMLNARGDEPRKRSPAAAGSAPPLGERDVEREAVLEEMLEGRRLVPSATKVKRGDEPSVPISQMPYPSFPAQYPSCYNCQGNYSSLSSCMEASAVFQNATSIFNSPLQYIAVIKCACTDTFRAAYPQCLDCFQHTNQCQYLGTDPKGTGAGNVVSNLRSVCGLGSAILGGAASANYPDYNDTVTPSSPGQYTDVTQTGPGYQDQSTGAIFQSSGGAPAAASPVSRRLQLGVAAMTVALTAGLSVLAL